MTVYATSHTKRRRATKAEMEQRRAALVDLARENHPASVRNLYYRAVVAGVVDKTESGYSKVQRALVDLRLAGAVPFEWITDNVRWRRAATTWDSLDEVLEITASTYRRALWTRAPETVEVWCESDSIAGVIWPVAERWDVLLLPVRGFSSITFAQSSAVELNRQRRPAVIYYIGDHDPAGLDIERNLHRYLDEWATVPVTFERVGVTWDQAGAMDLPGTAPKKEYGYPLSIEAEALPAPYLRELLEEAITAHLDDHDLDMLRIAEQSERETLYAIAGQVAE